MKTQTILLATALAAACTTQNNSALVITKVVPPKAEVSTDTPPVTTCKLDPADDEVSFLPINVTENDGNVGAVVENFIAATNTENSLNLDASAFLAHQAVIRIEFVGSAPPGVSVPDPIIVPVSGEVAGGATVSLPVPALPRGVITGTVPAGTFIRATFHIEGKLLGGNNVHTSEREYLFRSCDGAGCAQNICL
jgi:hypothetical protein